jgi:hypothetical protein
MRTLALIAVLSALVGTVASMANARGDGAVYVAGKGKYCKETSLTGYLDCFYVSLDACQKHNPSANLHCVPNPNSGT